MSESEVTIRGRRAAIAKRSQNEAKTKPKRSQNEAKSSLILKKGTISRRQRGARTARPYPGPNCMIGVRDSHREQQPKPAVAQQTAVDDTWRRRLDQRHAYPGGGPPQHHLHSAGRPALGRTRLHRPSVRQ